MSLTLSSSEHNALLYLVVIDNALNPLSAIPLDMVWLIYCGMNKLPAPTSTEESASPFSATILYQ